MLDVKGTAIGFLAQEVEQAALRLGFQFSGVDKPQNDKDMYGSGYAEFVVPLVKAVQEQQTLIDERKQTIELLSREVVALKVAVTEILRKQ